MNGWRTIGLSLCLALLIGAVFSWPLPRYLFSGIPSSSQNGEQGHVRRMIPGDHLQLLYHFWLFADMLAGKTPWFHNLYEFNTGDDAATYSPSACYVPFSLFYAAGRLAGGSAFGYNLSAFLSLWLSVLALWFLARRYTASRAGAVLAVLAGTVLPYRWANLLGGSPAGFGIMWVPAVWLGLDVAIRDRRISGGLLAGVCFLGLSFSDTHGFFFTLLFAPAWGLFALLAADDFDWRDWRDWLAVAVALAPTFALGLAAMGYNRLWHSALASSEVARGRELREVKAFSPSAAGLIAWARHGKESHVYIGVPALLLFAANMLAAVWCRGVRSRSWRPAALLLFGGIVGTTIVALALGTNGPFQGWPLNAARALIPPYRIVRQPFKIYALMPSLIAVLTAVGVTPLLDVCSRLRCQRILLAAIAAVLVLDARVQVRPTVSLLDTSQDAYRLAAEDARRARREPRALILPLWPGDSTYGSLYEHYASLYRIRMLNGYRPIVSQSYRRGVFERIESANLGAVTDAQLDDLLGIGVEHLLLHEDAFPEKVSPFSVAVTLDRLWQNPRLTFLGRGDSVWVFRIERAYAAQKRPARAGTDFCFPARRFEAETAAAPLARAASDSSAGGGGYAVVATNGASLRFDVRMASAVPALRWMLRARGEGTLRCGQDVGGRPATNAALAVRASDWQWFELPAPVLAAPQPLSLVVSNGDGTVDVDLAILAAGSWKPLRPGESLTIPADRFFHAGFSDSPSGAVTLRSDREPLWIVFYGPKLPFDPGTYEAVMDMTSTAPPGQEIARVNIRRLESDPVDWTSLVAGRNGVIRFEQLQSVPLSLELMFLRRADMTIRSVTFVRLTTSQTITDNGGNSPNRLPSSSR